jgi:serine/threonine protein kinase
VSVVKELQPGDPPAIGPYRLIGRLGEGGMGTVFLGLSPGGRPVAVKAVRAELAADPEFRTRFGREVAAARRVSGVFTAPVLDADIDGPVAWLATAYVPGPSLAEAVGRHGPLPEGSVLALAAGLAESLTAIHAAGVLHQDLTPSNVLLAEDGPRVIDFGISQAAESSSLTRAGPVIGSPGFMSPEQAMGGEVGPPSDIFSLGALLAFAATGQGPFGTGTTAALLYRVVHETPSLDQVPTAVRPLVEHCLAKDPGQRPTASGLLDEVGRLQPTASWLPDSIIRTFAQDAASGQAFAGSGSAFAGSGSAFAGPGAALASDVLAWPGEASTQVMAAVMGASAAAAYSPTSTSRSLPPPPGDARRQPPARRNRPRLRLGRPLVLACVIGALLVTGAFTLTSGSGSTPPAQGRTVAQLPSPTASTSATRKASASPSASKRASPKVSASPAPVIFVPVSASASPSKKPTPTPTASKKPTPTPTPTKKPTPTPTPSPTPTPTPTPTTTASPTPTITVSLPLSTLLVPAR